MTKQSKIYAPPFHVQSTAQDVRDGFPWFSYHDSVSKLWSEKWRACCAAGIYPFGEGSVADFEPIFATLIERSDNRSAMLYDQDAYAEPFLAVGDSLVAQADEAAARRDSEAAKNLFLRAATVYRIARFPIPRSRLGKEAWEKGKAAFEKGALLLDPPSVAVNIGFSCADPSAGDRTDDIQALLRLPRGPRPADGWPVLLLISGLDGYRTDLTSSTQAHIERGFATLTFEIPGTGDCPAAPNDPTSPDRLMSSILDWVAGSAQTHGLNPHRIVARGLSTGGYYAIRLAHTHADRLLAVVAQGGGCHHMFDADWIRAQNQMEYAFALAEALAYKFGYREPDGEAALARYTAEARKFSLLEAGILDRPSCRLLVINGMEDSIFPIEDSLIAATRGRNKDLVVIGNRSHMGAPDAEDVLCRWIDKVVAQRG